MHHSPYDIDQFIIHDLNDYVPSSTISILIFQSYNKVISQQYVYHYCGRLPYYISKKTSDLPYMTLVESLISEFSNKPDMSFVYVTLAINSGFVTDMKRKGSGHQLKYQMMESWVVF